MIINYIINSDFYVSFRDFASDQNDFPVSAYSRSHGSKEPSSSIQMTPRKPSKNFNTLQSIAAFRAFISHAHKNKSEASSEISHHSNEER